MPSRSRTLSVSSIPSCPWSSEWFDAVLHTSQPVLAIDFARSGGVLNTG